MAASFRKLSLGALLLLTTMAAAGAQDGAQDRTVVLSLGAASRLRLESAFETVIVGNPLIVGVRIDDDRSIVVEPLNPGATNLVFVDASGLVIANLRISVCTSSGSDAAISPGSFRCGEQAVNRGGGRAGSFQTSRQS